MAPPRCSVTRVEACLVAPPPNRPDSGAPTSLPLTSFDILWLRFPPVQRLFFYEVETTISLFYGSIIPKLKHSLSLTLHDYLPLAGTLIWPENSPKPMIEYLDGDGVTFTVAESHYPFHRLAADGIFPEASECHPLIPELPSSRERAQVVAFQVTLLPGSGFCVGLSSHHAVLDGKTSTSFMKSWARTCRSLGESNEEVIDPIEYRPFYDRTVFKDSARLEEIYTAAWMNEGGPENRSVKVWEFNLPKGSVRGTFELTRERIEKLRKSVAEKNGAVSVSTFSLACSYTSVCVAKALRTTREDNHGMTCIALPVDFRARLKPAVPATYFGNCVGGRAAVVQTEALTGEDGVSRALEAISRALKSLDDDEDVLKGSENLASIIIEGAKGSVVRDDDDDDDDGDSDAMKMKKKNSAVMVSFAGSPRFQVYSTDFGFGRPKKVEMSSIDRTGAICLSDSKNGNGGIEIRLVLKPKEMEAFASEFVKGLEIL